MARKKVRIGELLVESRVITEVQLRSALESQKKSGFKFKSSVFPIARWVVLRFQPFGSLLVDPSLYCFVQDRKFLSIYMHSSGRRSFLRDIVLRNIVCNFTIVRIPIHSSCGGLQK